MSEGPGYGAHVTQEVARRAATDDRPGAPAPLLRPRHGHRHLRIWPDAQFADGPPVENGFYYDFDLEHRITPDDFEKIEAEMKKIVKENQTFERIGGHPRRGDGDWRAERAARRARRAAGQPSKFKLDLLDEIPEGEEISLFKNGDFWDLCAGPARRPHRQLQGVQADERRQRVLQGRRGEPASSSGSTAPRFKNKHAARRAPRAARGGEEARPPPARPRAAAVPHRRGGRPGPDPLEAEGRARPPRSCRTSSPRSSTSRATRRSSRRTSASSTSTAPAGHFPYYQESQYRADRRARAMLEKLADEGATCADLDQRPRERATIDGYLLKPMNCPHHIKIFASDHHSYRDLPVRLAEFGTVYRWEQSRRARRHDPRPRLHPGRRPPLLHRRTRWRRRSAAASSSSRPCSARSA